MILKIAPSIGDDGIFYEVYDIDVPFTQNEITYFGVKSPRSCRFCGKSENETTFKKKAHLIPEQMGNKLFFSNYECDNCNKIFSKYEDSFANFGGIFNTLSIIKGKRGVPKHKHHHEGFEALYLDGALHLRMKPEDTKRTIEQDLLKRFDSVKVDEQNKLIHINTIKHPYIPKYAYKVLAKIGFSFLKETDLKPFSAAFDWLITPKHELDEREHPFFQIYKRIQPKQFPQPWGILFTKKPHLNEYPAPHKTMIIFYGHFSYQIFLPFSSEDDWLWRRNDIVIPIENHLVELDGTSDIHEFEHINLNSNEKRKGEKDSFQLGINPL